MPTHPSNHAGTSLSASTYTPPQETRRPQSLLSGMDESKLREALAQVAKATKPSAPSPAMNFGAYVRRAVDPEPGRGPSATDLARILRLDPISKEHDQLKDELAGLRKGMEEQAAEINQLRGETPVASSRPRSTHRRKTVGGRGARKHPDHWLLQLEHDVRLELRKEGYQRNELVEQLVERVHSLAADDLALAICDRFGGKKKKPIISGRTIRRGDTDWKTLPDGRRVKSGVTYRSSLYEKWKVFRAQAGVEPELVEGSCDEASGGVDGNRAVSLLDGASKGVRRRDEILDEVRDEKMTAHAGGGGTGRLRKAKDDEEENQDRIEGHADQLLRSAGLNPGNVQV